MKQIGLATLQQISVRFVTLVTKKKLREKVRQRPACFLDRPANGWRMAAELQPAAKQRASSAAGKVSFISIHN